MVKISFKTIFWEKHFVTNVLFWVTMTWYYKFVVAFKQNPCYSIYVVAVLLRFLMHSLLAKVKFVEQCCQFYILLLCSQYLLSISILANIYCFNGCLFLTSSKLHLKKLPKCVTIYSTPSPRTPSHIADRPVLRSITLDPVDTISHFRSCRFLLPNHIKIPAILFWLI